MNLHHNTLAWHETLELHELVALKSIGLMKVKMNVGSVQDDKLKKIYKNAIKDLEDSIGELLLFYPYTPKPNHSDKYRADYEEDEKRGDTGFYAGDLLALAKAEIKAYAIAITETITPKLRDVLKKQMIVAIKCHERIATYMYENDLYPAYNLKDLLQNDVKLAHKALKL